MAASRGFMMVEHFCPKGYDRFAFCKIDWMYQVVTDYNFNRRQCIETKFAEYLDQVTIPDIESFGFLSKVAPSGNYVLLLVNIFHVFIEKSWCPMVEKCMDKGMNINFICPIKGTALSIAIKNQDSKFAKWLISKGADPFSQCIRGSYYIHESLVYTNYALLKLFLDVGIDPDTPNPQGLTLLTILLSSNTAYLSTIMKMLLKKGADPTLCDQTGQSGLHILFHKWNGQTEFKIWWNHQKKEEKLREEKGLKVFY